MKTSGTRAVALFALGAMVAACNAIAGLDDLKHPCEGVPESQACPAPESGGGGTGGATTGSSATGGGSSSTGGSAAGGGGGLPAHCSDKLHDHGETDVDCGGADCSACGDGKGCQHASDCESNNCTMHKCVPAGCNDSTDCPMGQACDPATHACSKACDPVTKPCNGGCCIDATCAPGTEYGACGAGGIACQAVCVLGACSVVPEWKGGSCECGDDSHCGGVPTGPKCLGPPGSKVCGCLGNVDCGSGQTCNLVGFMEFNGGYCE